MSQPLTDRNGVVCFNCFATIDLTKLNVGKQRATKRVGFLKVKVYDDNFFLITCPYCQTQAKYAYDSIKPIAPSWEAQKQVYESKISLIRAQKDRAVADAKRLAELAHQEYPTEDFEEPELSSSSSNAPTPPEKPDPKKRTPGVV